jgi:hypothetical protein
MKSTKDVEFLWSTPGGRYALVRSIPGSDTELMPFDTVRREAHVIEDDELYDYVVRRMLEAGLPIIDLPGGPIPR